MPAKRFTKKANTPKKQKLWHKIYTKEKPRVGKIAAIREANGVIKKIK